MNLTFLTLFVTNTTITAITDRCHEWYPVTTHQTQGVTSQSSLH